MTIKDDRPKVGTEEHRQWLRDKLKKEWEKIAEAGGADFEEVGVLSGSVDTLFATDAELFPDEVEEHTPDERRRLIKIVPTPKKDI